MVASTARSPPPPLFIHGGNAITRAHHGRFTVAVLVWPSSSVSGVKLAGPAVGDR